MPEVNLLVNYPQPKRQINKRAIAKTTKIRRIARKFAKEYFDGDRTFGYGGYHYHPRFWQKVIPDFQKYYGLTKNSRILDIGCAKGFMLYDFMRLIPGIKVNGIDISEYAIKNALPEAKPFIKEGNATHLPYQDQSFDLIISINTIHNLPLEKLKQALKEIMRVTKKNAFITVDAYRTPTEKTRLEKWNLTAKTMLHKDSWKKLFKQTGYKGDYYWFIP